VKGETVTTTRESRDRLFTRLREVLGTEQANTLIDMLPPEIDRLATKADMEQIAARMEGLETRMEGLETRMEGLETRMEKLEDRVWDLHEALRAQTRIYLTATVGSMFGVGSLAFAAAGLL
jgi:chromosome segregation ATPase